MLHLTRIVAAVLFGSLAGCASVGTHSQQAMPEGKLPLYDKVTTFLMFEGDAEEAVRFYTSLFDDAEVTRIERFGPEGPGAEGKVLHATFTLGGRPFIAFDSPAPHGFTFTPAMSLFVMCESEAEFERLYEALVEGGEVAMPPGDYGFSPRFAWVVDRFGVAWQINVGGVDFDRAGSGE
jgi:predicted 3-demethylubiquinone-9 3-methyltransferase (glyoxalase superfamily)